MLFIALVVLLVHAVPAFACPYTRGATGNFAVFGEGTCLNGTISPAAVTLTGNRKQKRGRFFDTGLRHEDRPGYLYRRRSDVEKLRSSRRKRSRHSRHIRRPTAVRHRAA